MRSKIENWLSYAWSREPKECVARRLEASFFGMASAVWHTPHYRGFVVAVIGLVGSVPFLRNKAEAVFSDLLKFRQK